MAGIILVGLGPGAPNLLTVEALDILSAAAEIWVVSIGHPAIRALPNSVAVRDLASSDNNEHGDGCDPEAMLARAIELARRPHGVTVALPEHPLLGTGLGAALRRRAEENGIPCRVVIGLSLLDASVGGALPGSPTSVFVCTAGDIATLHIPPFPPDVPALVTGVTLAEVGETLRRTLARVYPARHEIILFSIADSARHTELPLAELAKHEQTEGEVCIYIPPLPVGSSLESLQEVIAHLRAPDGCPWDRKQTHTSLRPHLLEEAYEAIQAMDSGDATALREELGDLLLQIMLNAQIASEAGDFTLNDVTMGIHEKLIRRHPHVFGELKVADVDGVLANWEKLKEGERAKQGDASGLLEGVPAALPALSQAQEYQDRAARVGFDWPEISGVLEKISEEVEEVRAATDASALEAEIGDLLFSLVNFARWKSVDAESCLRAANQRFRRRFRHIEAVARQEGRRLTDLSAKDMDTLWNEAKSDE
ncbi:MAG TPA: nucleoside triphosphate pyrophosphohydrolase [Anaerolineales bacterium]|nr:nucleoside triphosphate pyrophosphohydrolase [Anaerolineales bacterium]